MVTLIYIKIKQNCQKKTADQVLSFFDHRRYFLQPFVP
jgi:hypothetical protein